MAKKTKKASPAPSRMTKLVSGIKRHRAAATIALAAATALGAAFAGGERVGSNGIASARQEACEAGVSRLFFNLSGGQTPPADKVTEFCAAVLKG